eukprot:CAMPEP_0167766348 /NCGR_PEP_ID=MMETSP0110_2-20121227/15291_1 /TAXON_ID=629695 /ORGANISM="Gymnochlora sp., Strain CCMP2014" /LENGTH=537 /DNA_ID=CAMNT_0007654359 /DNA_START=134 /DNA_END=1747 /DNA_ORIENTATION=-
MYWTRLIAWLEKNWCSSLRFRGGMSSFSAEALRKNKSFELTGTIPRLLIKHVLDEADSLAGEELVVKGWVRSRRTQERGNLCFFVVNDGSTMHNLQVVCERNRTDGFESLSAGGAAGTGASVGFLGRLVASSGSGQEYELQAKRGCLIGPVSLASAAGTNASRVYPLAKKHHSLEVMRTLAHLRPRSNLGGAVARVRNELTKGVHDFLQDLGYKYVHTPVLTKSDCEGAGEAFAVDHKDLLNSESMPTIQNLSLSGESRKSPQYFFGHPTYLTVSGQLNLEAFCCSLGNCYAFGPTFRAEKSHTGRHLAEFWMLEPELAFADMNAAIDVASSMIKNLTARVISRCSLELEFFKKFIDADIHDRLNRIAMEPFTRITYTKALELLRNATKPSGKKKLFSIKDLEWGLDLRTEHERYLTEQIFKRPVVVTNYPKGIKAFYMRENEDNTTVAAFDILFPRIGELVGGSQREERLDRLLDRMIQAKLKLDDYDWYIDLRRFGSMPHSGFGIGFDRLVQLLTGIENIRDVIPFPRVHGSIDF